MTQSTKIARATFLRINDVLIHKSTITHVTRDITGYKRHPTLIIHNSVPSLPTSIFWNEYYHTHKTYITFDSFNACDDWYDILQNIVDNNVYSNIKYHRNEE